MEFHIPDRNAQGKSNLFIALGLLNQPHDVVVDDNGNIYIADTENHRIVILPVSDADGDGASNMQERTAGTNPFDAASYLYLKADKAGNAGGWRVVSWQSSTGRLYSVSISTSLRTKSWSSVPAFINVPGTGSEMRYTNKATQVGNEFYRVRVDKTLN